MVDEVFVVFNKTDHGYRKPFHSIEGTESDAIDVVKTLQKAYQHPAPKSLIYYQRVKFGENL